MSVNTNCELDSTCLLCMQQLHLPMRLWPCTHSFCQNCLRQWELSHSMRLPDSSTCILCPSCNQRALLQERVDVLPRNGSVNNSALKQSGESPMVTRTEVQTRLREARTRLEKRQGDIVVSIAAIRNRSKGLTEEARQKKEEIRYLMHSVQEELNKRRFYLEDQIDDVREQATCYCEHRLDQLNESSRLLANFAEGLSELMNLSFASSDDICEVELTEFLDGVEKVVATTEANPKEDIPIATPNSFRLPGIDISVLVDALVLDSVMPIPPRGFYRNRGSHQIRGSSLARAPTSYGVTPPGPSHAAPSLTSPSHVAPCLTGSSHAAPCHTGSSHAAPCHTGSCHANYGYRCNACNLNRQWNNSENPFSEGVIIDSFFDGMPPSGLNHRSDASDNACGSIQVGSIPEHVKALHCLAAEDTPTADCKMTALAPSVQQAGGEPVAVQDSSQSHVYPGRTMTSDVVQEEEAVRSAGQAGGCDRSAPGEWLGVPEAGEDTTRGVSDSLPRRESSGTESGARPAQTATKRSVRASCRLHGSRHRNVRNCNGPAPTETYNVTVQEKTLTPPSEFTVTANTIFSHVRSGSHPPTTQPWNHDPLKRRSIVEVTVEEATEPSGGSNMSQVNTLEQHPTFRTQWVLDKNRSSKSISDTTIASSAVNSVSRPNTHPFSKINEKSCLEHVAVDAMEVDVTTGLIEDSQKFPNEEASPQAGQELRSMGEIPDTLLSPGRGDSCVPRARVERQRSTSTTLSAPTHALNKPMRHTLLPPLEETNGVSRKDSPLPALASKLANNSKLLDLGGDNFCHTSSNRKKLKKTGDRRTSSSEDSSRSDSGSSVRAKLSRHGTHCEREKPLVPLIPSCAPSPDRLPLREDNDLHTPLEVECKVVVTDRIPLLTLTWNSSPGADQYKVSTHDLGMAEVGETTEGSETPKGVFLVEAFTTDTKVTLQHGQFEHSYAVTVTALSPDGILLACTLPAIVRIPRMIHFHHLQFDPQGCHADVAVDASLHAVFRRRSSSVVAREERCPHPLLTLPGSFACPALPWRSASADPIYWECEVQLRVALLGQSCETICSVGLCQENAVDQEDNLAANRRSICVSLFQAGFSVALRFWDGWRRAWVPSQNKVQVMEIVSQPKAILSLGFLLLLSRRSLVLVDVSKDAVLHKFQLPKREVTWIPTACLSDQDIVDANVTWQRPQALPGCLLDLID